MTTDTTDSAAPPAPYPAPPPRRKQRPLWPWLISLGINAVLVVVLFFLGHSVFELDTEAERERTEEVRLRELARQELERQQRAEIQLTRQQAEMLQERERRKTRDELRVQIEQMREDRREMQRLREEAFEKLRQRPLEEMVRQELEPVRREVEAARKRLEGSAEHAETEDFRKKQQERAEQAKELEALIEDTAANPEQYNDRRPEIQQEARKLKDAARDGQREPRERPKAGQSQTEIRAASSAFRSADEADREARKLRERIDLEEMNDTASAEDLGDPGDAEYEQASGSPADPGEVYEQARRVEGDVARLHDDVKAAEVATSTNSSFAEAKAMISPGTGGPSRPDLAAALRGEAGGEASGPATAAGSPPDPAQSRFGEGNTGSSASTPGGERTTLGAVRASREAMGQARQQVAQMQANTAAMVAQANNGIGRVGGVDGLAMLGVMQRAASSTGFADMTGFADGGLGSRGGSGQGSSETDLPYDPTAEGAGMVAGQGQPKLVIPETMAKANALPGRVFTDDAARRGWLYLDTWWVIGPWENKSKVDWDHIHPPEYDIDFDAQYAGKDDRTLEWEFIQSDRIDVTPPLVRGASTYYAYTEVHADRDRDVLVAVAADDAASLWVNGNLIWREHGQSVWNMGESQRLIRLQAGVNTVLLRLENGPAHAIWSVLLAPPEAVQPTPGS